MQKKERQALEKLLAQIKEIRQTLSPSIPIQQVQVLLEVAMAEGMAHKEIYEKLAPLSSSSTARGLKELSKSSWKANAEGTRRREGYNLVMHKPDEMEMRIKRAYLTDEGKALISRLADLP